MAGVSRALRWLCSRCATSRVFVLRVATNADVRAGMLYRANLRGAS